MHLHDLALSIDSTCRQNNIYIFPQWVPRSENEKADAISRIVDSDDWSVAPEVFHLLENRWGPHSIDRFASNYNSKLPRFNSRYWNPGSETIDAFSVSWARENNWLVPPISLVARTILHLRDSRGCGTLVAPYWKSAPFWPLINNVNGNFIDAVKDSIIFGRDITISGRGGAAPLTGHTFTRFMALRLNFT